MESSSWNHAKYSLQNVLIFRKIFPKRLYFQKSFFLAEAAFNVITWLATVLHLIKDFITNSAYDMLIIYWQNTSSCNYNGTNNYLKKVFYSSEGYNCSLLGVTIPMSNNVYHIETSQLAPSVNQMTGFYKTKVFTFEIIYRDAALVYEYYTNWTEE